MSMQELTINSEPVQSLEPSFLRVVTKSSVTDESNMVTLPTEASVVQAATLQPVSVGIPPSLSPFGVVLNPHRGRRYFTKEQCEEVIAEALREIQRQIEIIAEFSEWLRLMSLDLDSSLV
mmetsp:Transcript_19729/g.28143  ORF Transcript_19729/g.28143 Transcript_19729/m.28143 type:complete len:120 (+) Transcript_19729:173-532(+)